MRLEFISEDEKGYITFKIFERDTVKECLIAFICDCYEYEYKADKVYKFFNVIERENLEDYLYTHNEEELLNFLKENSYEDNLRCIRNLDALRIIFKDKIYHYINKRKDN